MSLKTLRRPAGAPSSVTRLASCFWTCTDEPLPAVWDRRTSLAGPGPVVRVVISDSVWFSTAATSEAVAAAMFSKSPARNLVTTGMRWSAATVSCMPGRSA